MGEMGKSDSKQGDQRVAFLQARMREQGIDLMISAKPEHTFYLSGFNPILYSHPVIAILPAHGSCTLLVHALRDDHARSSTWAQSVKLYGAWSTKVTMGPDWLQALKSIVGDLGYAAGTIGIEEDFLPIRDVAKFKRTFPDATFVDGSKIIHASRLIKEPSEIANARIAAKLADVGTEAAIEDLAAGGSERSAVAAGQSAMMTEWATKYPDIEVCAFGSLEGGVHSALWTWVLTGDRVLVNTDNPTMRKPASGEIAIAFSWAVCNGMYAENERAVAIGKLSDERKQAFDAILEIREQTAKMIGPGVPVAALYEEAVTHYRRLGYGKNVPGRIGHGMGLGPHEEPSIDGRSDIILKPGMIFTFEPNLRLDDFGLQHSDTLLVTETGFEYLTDTPRGYREIYL